YLVECGAALAADRRPPPRDVVEDAFEGFASTIERLRRGGVTRGLPADEVERLFALGFAFDQMRKNIADLERCTAEWSNSRTAKGQHARILPGSSGLNLRIGLGPPTHHQLTIQAGTQT